jgi:indoleamine 2,3-dioxygenase
MVKAIDAAQVDDRRTVTACLLEFVTCLEESGVILERMYEKCSPEIFYHQIRPFFAGSKNMTSAGLPNGVYYEDYDGTGQWRQYSGGSNAQSSLIQFFDVVLGVEHVPTKNSKLGSAPPSQSHSYLKVRRHFVRSRGDA